MEPTPLQYDSMKRFNFGSAIVIQAVVLSLNVKEWLCLQPAYLSYEEFLYCYVYIALHLHGPSDHMN